MKEQPFPYKTVLVDYCLTHRRAATALGPTDRRMLGWLHHQRGDELAGLSLRSLVPSHERDGVRLVFDYMQWLTRERGVGVRTIGLVVRAAGQAARFVHHDKSEVCARNVGCWGCWCCEEWILCGQGQCACGYVVVCVVV